ncbi:MAG: cysteine synthase [Bacteroidetes bacterium]|nr:MAG: cysteine synthase [Bacteroidota bacterium]
MSNTTTIALDSRELLLERLDKLRSLIGNTSLYHFKSLTVDGKSKIFAKLEWEQLSKSVKARAGYEIIADAIHQNKLNENKILLDATSGNTGIAYAEIGARLGIRVALCLPENASKERKQILESLGVEIIYTSKFEGTDGAQAVARELAVKYPDKYFYADQYRNPNNWKAHYLHTAQEIFDVVPGISHFVAGLGTTGTFVGTGRKLRELNPDIKLISLQPDSALHGLEGWKHLETAIVPKIYDADLADENYEVSTEEAYEMIRRIFKEEGLLLSPSSAANLVGAKRVAENFEGAIIVTMLPDNADKYSEVIKKIL